MSLNILSSLMILSYCSEIESAEATSHSPRKYRTHRGRAGEGFPFVLRPPDLRRLCCEACQSLCFPSSNPGPFLASLPTVFGAPHQSFQSNFHQPLNLFASLIYHAVDRSNHLHSLSLFGYWVYSEK